MEGATAAAAPAQPAHKAEGVVKEIDKASLLIQHGAIPSAGMGAMTMDFKLPPPNQLPRKLAPGDRITFEFFMAKEGPPQITHLSPSSTPAPQAAASSPAQGARQ